MAVSLLSPILLHTTQFTGSQIADQLQEEVDKIKKEGVPAAELQRVRALLRAERIREMQTSMNRARALGLYEVLDGDPSFINRDLAALTAVTGEQIQAVAVKYLTPEKRSILTIIPAPVPAKQEAK